jgi:hypothetical protein
VGETIDQTRLEIAAQRAELEATAERLRDALDLRKRIREHPATVIGIGAAAAFLLVGGPRRVARALRGTVMPHAAEEAYEALPETMQAWVTTLAREAGPRSEQVRDELVEELRRWRRDPIRDKKARKELARQMVEGPPGPQRAAWTAAETALTLLAAALARRAVARFLTDEPAPRRKAPAANDEPKGEAAPKGGADVTGSGAGYTGWSGRDRPAAE